MLNKTADVVKVPENLLVAAIARSRNDLPAAIVALNAAVAAKGRAQLQRAAAVVPARAPPPGGPLVGGAKPREAEKVFRADLDRNPRDGRALAGLRDTLKAQGREYEALQIDQQYRDAWKTADAKTSLVR